MNVIKEFQDTSSQAVKGCHFVLMIIYFKERYDGKSLNDPNVPAPWIQRWSGDLLKEKTKAEDEDITRVEKKGTVRKEKNPEDDSESMEFDIEEGSEEEEYHTTDSETESDTEEVQQGRKSKRKEEESVIHQRQRQERKERSRRREQGKEDKEPTLAKEIEQIKKRKLQRKDEANKKEKTATEEGNTNPPPHMDIPTHDATIPEPEPEPVMPVMQFGPEPEPETVIEIRPEPQEVIDGFVVACEQAEENVAAIKACEEVEAQFKSNKQKEMEKDNEIDVNIRRIVEDVVAEARQMEAQEKEAASDLNKDQPAPGLMMVASVATQADDYNSTKAFDLLRFGTQPPQREETAEIYDLNDFPEEQENPVTPAVPARTVVPDRPAAAETNQISSDLKEICVVWALSNRKKIKYDSIFMVDGE
ncbi:hypothetical protein PIB30_076492 [Stylosanthes scabra]|uniref:Uncharacterized protein n=1 Tax=Stylosanthes scabra TaxID=79078 RepID=A0ABU6USZ4_9FABA|nr:hypothetical protein [Stylosanthes scabra]